MALIRRFGLLAGVLLALLSATGGVAAEVPAGLSRIEHIVVIYLENRSFDNLYGLFPGANGLAQSGATATQVDRNGTPYPVLPPVMMVKHKHEPTPDPRFPADLPNAPFRIDRFVPLDQPTGDLVHRFYTHQAQIDGGRLDKFAAWSNAGGLTMGYYDGSGMRLWAYAREFTLADNFFQAAFGGSFLNHFWLVCACTPRFPDAPPAMVATFDAAGAPVKDAQVTPDGYAVNTTVSTYLHPADADPAKLLPPQDAPTIGDRLSEKRVSWAWYSGGWRNASAGHADRLFQFHHQPFAAFARYAPGTEARERHLKDADDLLAAIDAGTLPQVAFYKPIGEFNQHPGYAEVASGDLAASGIIDRIRNSPLWDRTAIVVTYDENGGFWDHVPPPKGDRWGPGSRIPAIVISPFAKRGHIDHTVYDTTSILKLIELRYGLEPLGSRDAAANGLLGAFDFDAH